MYIWTLAFRVHLSIVPSGWSVNVKAPNQIGLGEGSLFLTFQNLSARSGTLGIHPEALLTHRCLDSCRDGRSNPGCKSRCCGRETAGTRSRPAHSASLQSLPCRDIRHWRKTHTDHFNQSPAGPKFKKENKKARGNESCLAIYTSRTNSTCFSSHRSGQEETRDPKLAQAKISKPWANLESNLVCSLLLSAVYSRCSQ